MLRSENFSDEFSPRLIARRITPSALASFLAALLLVGCGTPHRGVPADQRYVPPVITASTAFIAGTKMGRLLLGEATAYVRAVDKLNVVDPRINWDKPLPLEPGQRTITVVFAQKGFHFVYHQPLTVEAGKQYEVRFKARTSVITGQGSCDLWIANKTTGQPVTDLVTPESAPITVPIIIPVPT